jgi:uncharacterized membrane protein YcfT
MQRVEWVDVAKGLAIVLVAIYHANLLLSQSGLGVPVWDDINAVFVTVRMPLFFLAAGIFAASVVQRPWRMLWASRLALLAWAFLLWTVIRFVYFSVVPMELRPFETSVTRLLAAPVWPTSGLWFLHALVVFFVASKLMWAHVPPAWQLGLAAVCSVAFFSYLSVRNLSYDGMARYFLFFLAGLHLRGRILSMTAEPRPAVAALALFAFGGAVVAVKVFDLAAAPGVLTLLGIVAVTASVLLARVLAATPLVRPLTFLGRNTLPIYVTHVILIAMVATVLAKVGVPVEWLIALPPLVAAAVIAVALLAERLASRSVLRFLYAVPPPLLFEAARPVRLPGAQQPSLSKD